MWQEKLTYSFENMNPEDRLAELLVYIAAKCSDDPSFGAIKLNKILYFADFMSYMQYGEPITGTEYMRLGNGPVPKHLVPVREKMRAKGAIGMEVKPFQGGKDYHRIVALQAPNLDLFKSRDIWIIDEVIKMLWGKRANVVSELSHGIAWKIARDHESIPYQAAYLEDDVITQDDINRAQELANEYGWSD
jgi:hypothetical protein